MRNMRDAFGVLHTLGLKLAIGLTVSVSLFQFAAKAHLLLIFADISYTYVSLRLVALGFHRARCLGLSLMVTGLIAALVVLVCAVGASWVIRVVESRCLSSISLVNIAVISASLSHWQLLTGVDAR